MSAFARRMTSPSENVRNSEDAHARMADLVRRIHDCDPNGETELYNVINNGLRYLLIRQIGCIDDVDDRVHELYLIVIRAIREERLRDASRLMGFIRAVMHHQVAGYIQGRVTRRRREVTDDAVALTVRDSRKTPEQQAIHQQQVRCAREMLAQLRERDREILLRFYVKGEAAEQIRTEMRLTETQFRLIKSRAKLKFEQLVQARLNQRTTEAEAPQCRPARARREAAGKAKAMAAAG